MPHNETLGIDAKIVSTQKLGCSHNDKKAHVNRLATNRDGSAQV